MKELPIDFKVLKRQIKMLLDSNMQDPMKDGLHMLLGEILDFGDKLREEEGVMIKIIKRKDNKMEHVW